MSVDSTHTTVALEFHSATYISLSFQYNLLIDWFVLNIKKGKKERNQELPCLPQQANRATFKHKKVEQISIAALVFVSSVNLFTLDHSRRRTVCFAGICQVGGIRSRKFIICKTEKHLTIDKMEEFQLDDFDLNFNFDFNQDFDRNENQLINEILNEPFQLGLSTNSFDTSAAAPFQGNEMNYSIENVSDLFGNFANMDSVNNFSTDSASSIQLNVENCSSMAAEETYQIFSDANESFDWSAFLQKSPLHEVIVEENEMPVDVQSALSHPIEIENHDDDNVIVYEGLQNLNGRQIYNDVKSKFELMELMSIDKNIDYDDLLKRKMDTWTVCNQKKEKQQQVLFLPTNYPADEKTDALMNKLQNDSSIANSLLIQCNATAKNSHKIVIQRQPKQITQKSTKFLTIAKQLAQIDCKEVNLVTIEKAQVKHLRKSKAEQMQRQAPINQTMAFSGKPLICTQKTEQRLNKVPAKNQTTALSLAKEHRRSQRTRQ